MRVTLLTQADCAFCGEADALLRRLASEYALEVQTLDVASSEGQRLATEGGIMFPPGILLGGEAVLYGRPSERRLRREIEHRLAAGRGGTSGTRRS
jgi:hypothetical protein